MTSEERRKGRYERRRAKREAERKVRLAKYDDFEAVASLDALDGSADEAQHGVKWKASVQRYNMRRMTNIYKTRRELLDGGDPRRGFICFCIWERGKLRRINSVRFYERVVQKSLCRNALYPLLTNGLIYDNGASQRGKGTQFALDRLTVHLMRHIHRHGREGGILLIDFSDYFGQADHEAIREIHERAIADPRLRRLAWLFVDAFGEIGLGLGSETSQINAVALRSGADHYAKEILGIKGYGAYMDDSYLIHEDAAYLAECLERLKAVYAKYGIKVNEKKTKICDLKHGFTYLKTRFYITESGRIIKKPCREAVPRERRKLKKQAKLLEDGVLTYQDIRTSYASWKGSMAHRNAYRTVKRMDELFDELFINNWHSQQ